MGKKIKKYKYEQLKTLLLSNYQNNMQSQLGVLDITLNNWKGSMEQVDNVCVIGVKM